MHSNTVDRPIRVVVADDDADIRQLVRINLEYDGRFEVVGEAAEGEEAVRVVTSTKPDVTVLDLSMPRLNGLQAIPRIRLEAPEVRILVYSCSDGLDAAEDVLLAGAHEYVEKSIDATLIPSRLFTLYERVPPAHRPDRPGTLAG